MDLIDLPLDLHYYIILQSEQNTIKEKQKVIKVILTLIKINKCFNIIYNNKILWDKLFRENFWTCIPQNSKNECLRIFRCLKRKNVLLNIYKIGNDKFLYALIRYRSKENLLTDLKYCIMNEDYKIFGLMIIGKTAPEIKKYLIKEIKPFIRKMGKSESGIWSSIEYL